MRWLLRLGIRGYQRYLSGRGPLARVTCSFASSESCSAYGLRVATESQGTMEALRLIRQRLSRCGMASMYKSQDDLAFGELYDDLDPSRFYALLTAARESPESVALVARGAAQCALLTGRQDLARQHARRAGGAGAMPPLRDARRVRTAWRWRLLMRLSLLGLGLGLWPVFGPWSVAPVILLGPLLLLGHLRRAQRLDRLLCLCSFTRIRPALNRPMGTRTFRVPPQSTAVSETRSMG
jgi:putative component of membrane protein insertase Oxa1/YidC/SpoIIIJ protein YidD